MIDSIRRPYFKLKQWARTEYLTRRIGRRPFEEAGKTASRYRPKITYCTLAYFSLKLRLLRCRVRFATIYTSCLIPDIDGVSGERHMSYWEAVIVIMIGFGGAQSGNAQVPPAVSPEQAIMTAQQTADKAALNTAQAQQKADLARSAQTQGKNGVVIPVVVGKEGNARGKNQKMTISNASAAPAINGSVPWCQGVLDAAQRRGYNVLQYNAQSGMLMWYGRRRGQVVGGVQVTADNAAFFQPQVYTNDLIMVEVCGLKFDTQVTVGFGSIAIPEKVADIRGGTTTSTTAEANTADALQAVSTAVNSAMAATIPPNAPLATISANALVTPGFASNNSYTMAGVKITAEDYVRAVTAYKAEAQNTLNAIQTLQIAATTVSAQAGQFSARIQLAASDADSPKNTGSFDINKAEALQYVAKLAAFDSQITQAALGARAAQLASNYNSLAGDLITIRNLLATDLTPPPSPNPPQPAAPQANCEPIAPPPTTTPPTIISVATYRLQEACFLQAFVDQVGARVTISAGTSEIQGAVTPMQLYQNLAALRVQLAAINTTVTTAFGALNDWYENSNVVYTDNVTPSSTNLNIRVGINATEAYVPFTLNYSATAPAAQPQPPTGHYEALVEIEVQRRVHFNLEGGFFAIHVPTKSFSFPASSVQTPAAKSSFMPCGGSASVTVPTTTSGTPPTYYCATVTQSSNWQVAGLAGVTWIPWGRNYYPKPGRLRHFKNYGEMIGLMLGTSVTSLGSGFAGLSVEPVNGISFFGGIASAHSSSASASGLGAGIYTTSSPPTITSTRFGAALGMGFDLAVFGQIFKSASAPTMP
jgi:hypothetical protein